MNDENKINSKYMNDMNYFDKKRKRRKVLTYFPSFGYLHYKEHNKCHKDEGN